MESRNIELLPGGSLPKPDSTELELVFGNMVLTNFYEENTGRGYWDSGELPDIDLAEEPAVPDPRSGCILCQSEQPGHGHVSRGQLRSRGRIFRTGEDAEEICCPCKRVVAGGTEEYNANSYSVFCDLDTLRNCLQKEFRGRAIPGQPTTKSGKPYKQFVYSSASGAGR